MAVAGARTRLALNNILFATDFSDASRNALPFAAAMARRYDSSVLITNIVEEVPTTSVPMDPLPPEIDHERSIASRHMADFLKGDSLAGIKTEVIIESGFIWPVLAKMAEERKIDLIVLGTHGRGAFGRLLLGSVAEEICRHAPCPVITIGPHVKLPSGGAGRMDKILFATDFSAGSIHALCYALAFAEEYEASLTLLHVVQAQNAPPHVSELLFAESEKKLRSLISPEDQAGRPPAFVTLRGVPAEQIVALATRESVNLIVMGMHKPGAFAAHWPFEVAAQVVARAECPVMSVRS